MTQLARSSLRRRAIVMMKAMVLALSQGAMVLQAVVTARVQRRL